MNKLGFSKQWIEWIMECITTVSYSIQVNGELCGYIKPTRGIRQGDPLSPYLFLLCAEGLTNMIRNAEAKGELHGVKISRNGPAVSHLLFADDSLLFCRALQKESDKIISILNTYEGASGQQINFDKCSIFFSKNTPADVRSMISSRMNIRNLGGQDKYLGLPAIINKSKRETFSEIKDKVAKRLQGWKGRLLSEAGREVLIKAVASAVPVYTMSCFKLPKRVCKDINSMVAKFWWGQKYEENRIHWIKWEKMCSSKNRGGMGFRDIEAFNLALLAKQGWKLVDPKPSLLQAVMKGKYYPNSLFFMAGKGSNPSWAWRSILEGREILKRGIRWRVGDGKSINYASDPWLPTEFPFQAQLQATFNGTHGKVSQLVNQGMKEWNADLIRQIFTERDAVTILLMQISKTGVKDKMIWHFTSSGQYTVKSGYHVATELIRNTPTVRRNEEQVNSIESVDWKMVWKVKIPQKVKIFLWRCLHKRLSVRANLAQRVQGMPSSCANCNDCTETEEHIMFQCPKATQVWYLYSHSITNSCAGAASITEWWQRLLSSHKAISDANINVETTCIICLRLWKARNDKVFNEGDWTPLQILDKARAQLQEYQDSQRHVNPDGIQGNNRNRPLQPESWQPPRTGFTKLNVDAAVDSMKCIGSGAVVVRDSTGLVTNTWSRRYQGMLEPLVLEALCFREAMVKACEWGLRKIIVEGDSKVVVDSIQNSSQMPKDIQVIVMDIICLASNFETCLFSFVP